MSLRRAWLKWGRETQKKRTVLLAGDPDVLREALELLDETADLLAGRHPGMRVECREGPDASDFDSMAFEPVAVTALDNEWATWL